MKTLTGLIESIIYGYSLGEIDKSLKGRIVAAGDPRKNLEASYTDVYLKREDSAKVANLSEYEVSGFSMFPCGIASEDHVFVKNGAELTTDCFVVVGVEDEYYGYSEKPIYADRKLRRYIMDVPSEWKLTDIENHLVSLQPEARLEYYKKCLAQKFEKTKKVYPSEELCLSYTYKDGEFRYSFHPKRKVEGVVEYVYSRCEQRLIPQNEIGMEV